MSDDARSARRRLVIFGRRDCHLCEDMLCALRSLAAASPFDIEYVDVDSDPALQARYGRIVPVLAGDDREICRSFLDEAAVRAHLAEFG